MAQKPSIPKGTRDFSPTEMAKRNYIFNTISNIFELYGFAPLETPATENLSTLMGKYGEEGDKLLFKILNSGDFLKGVDTTDKDYKKLTADICEKGLRYDLTVPFARYVVMNQNNISFPFKRYQIQPVWRADRPQRGRYREFYQCDIDVIGTQSLFCEVELVQIASAIFQKLGMDVVIKINNRKILTGIAEIIGSAEHIVDITVAIDKLDKIGLDAVNAELLEKGISQDAIQKLQPIINLKGSNQEKIDTLTTMFATSEIGKKGLEELQTVLDNVQALNLPTEVEFDVTLARGLNYYTGAIFEVKAKDVVMGSISGGGRYDDLTGIFGLKGMSGVGISFGADRIYDVLTELNLFPANINTLTQVLFINFGDAERNYCMPVLNQLRAKGIRAEMYLEPVKIKKQMTYADSKQIAWVVLAGEEEMKQQRFVLKNMQTGEQQTLSAEELVNSIH